METDIKPKILIVDDIPANLILLRRLLAKLDVLIIEAESGKDALGLSIEHDFALFILDVQMPEMDGYELAEKLQNNEQTREIPIIFITAAFRDDIHKLDGYKRGAIDYIEKPINTWILIAKVSVLLTLWNKNQKLIQLMEEISLKNFELQTEIAERKKLEVKLDRMATYDSLTNLPNRNLLKNVASKQLSAADRYNYNIVFMFVDLDGFKQVNDNNGHEIGDLVLIELSYRLIDAVRSCDIVTRFGGDEFIIILPNCKLKSDIEIVAKRILDEIQKPLNMVEINQKLGASIGIAVYPDHAKTTNDLITLADQAMYKAKKQGKNQYNFYTANK